MLSSNYGTIMKSTERIPKTFDPVNLVEPTSGLTRLKCFWSQYCEWMTSVENRIYIGWFGVLMIPTGLTAAICFLLAFLTAPLVDMDGIREPIMGSLLGSNNIITAAVMPTSAAIGLHFYPLWEASSVDEWLYNGGPCQLCYTH